MGKKRLRLVALVPLVGLPHFLVSVQSILAMAQAAVPLLRQSARRAGQAPVIDDEDDEDGEALIEFESDFDEDDPDNDINLHRHEVGVVPRGSRPAPPLNRDEHSAAVQGVRQQALPFNAPPPAPPVPTNKRAGRAARSQPEAMEPLVPNPLLAQQNANAAIQFSLDSA